jgi:hypothetical protein
MYGLRLEGKRSKVKKSKIQVFFVFRVKNL